MIFSEIQHLKYMKTFSNNPKFVSVCIDQIPSDEHDTCPICGSKNFTKPTGDPRNCRSEWQSESPRDRCKGYNEKPLANLTIKDICKGTCNNCGKYVVCFLSDYLNICL